MLREGQVLVGHQFHEPMRVESVRADGAAVWAVGLVGLHSRKFQRVTLTADDLATLQIQDTALRFDGDGRLFRLGLEAARLALAYQFDPYFALSVSRVDPLPHQLDAVYNHLLQLGRVRFLLADEPERGPEFLRLANALSALYPGHSEEKRLLDAILLAVPR
jgi:hypothetical protein